MSFIKRLLNKSQEPLPDASASPPATSLESQLQAMRLELADRDELISRLRAELENQRSHQESLIAERSMAQMESLLSDLAAPASQIITQADLVENQEKPVLARDILLVARRMIRILERRGLQIEGAPGELVSFDPALHQPLNAGANPQPGQPVTIRFAGIRYGSKMLLKAMVERA